MPPSTYLARTYSRRSNAKRKRQAEVYSDREDTVSTDSSGKKRTRTISDEGLKDKDIRATTPPPPPPSSHHPLHVEGRKKISRTYSGATTAKRQRMGEVKGSTSIRDKTPPPRLARDLSEVFDSATPPPRPSPPPRTPQKLARRMLSRPNLKADSPPPLSTTPSRHRTGLERTQSLPTVLSSPPSRDKGKGREVYPDPNQDPTFTTTTTTNAPPLLPLARPTSNVVRTYAGKSRSFLVPLPTTSTHLPPGLALTIGDDEEDDFLTRESYSSLRARWGVDNSEDDPYPIDATAPSKGKSGSGSAGPGTPSRTTSPRMGKQGGKKTHNHHPSVQSIPPLPNGMMNPLKSITELRSKGESRRFLDEVGYLLEGMDKKGAVTLRRTSALDIVTKLCDVEFARKAKAADFFGRIWDVFVDAGAGKNQDKILDLLLAFLAALITRDKTSLHDLAHRTQLLTSGDEEQDVNHHHRDRPSFVDVLFSLLTSCTSSTTSDLLTLIIDNPNLATTTTTTDLKRAGLSKKDRIQVGLIHNTISSKSRLFPPGTRITTPLLLVYTLQNLQHSLIQPGHLPILLTSLRTSLYPLPAPAPPSSPTETYSSLVASHLSWRDATSRIGFECVTAHLRLLDTFLLGQWQTTTTTTTTTADDDDDDDDDDNEGGNGAEGDDRSASEGDGELSYRGALEVLETARGEWLLDALIALGVCAEMGLRKEASLSEHLSFGCLEMVLRVLVSSTHADENWSRMVLGRECALSFVMREEGTDGLQLQQGDEDGTETVISDWGEGEGTEGVGEGGESGEDNHGEESRVLDRLCLALGLLTNLVQVVDGAGDVVKELRLDPSCGLKKSGCIKRCMCVGTVGGLEVLVRLYTRLEVSEGGDDDDDEGVVLGQEEDRDAERRREADMLFLRGHLAVLFGLFLMRGGGSCEEALMDSLPSCGGGGGGGGGRREKLGRLVEQAREFVSFYRTLLMGAAVAIGEGEGVGVSRGKKLKKQDGDEVAQGVVEYLQALIEVR
ncbi:hypothetical protein AMATHDRAFT_199190 [Amanita thiersii Skay4041]|uniref:Wings apart-like protein C-terminal domain-containing protein n=1 Tax=Amanita thiersii Skay4041 TaxID=703135 RepID=A0A2A9NEI1_9AGAR|nr:hypothetical protein AMATHDRAFT_199190 [Amanita thiersii Skay4041]